MKNIRPKQIGQTTDTIPEKWKTSAILSLNLSHRGKVVTCTGRLDLFTNYLDNSQGEDVYTTSLFAAKLSTCSLTLIYD